MSINGVIYLGNKEYKFFLNRRFITIPCNMNEKNDIIKELKSLDYTEYERIKGVTSKNRNIEFIRSKLLVDDFFWYHSDICISIQGYIIDTSNTNLTGYDLKYDSITFYGDAVDTFYPPRKKVVMSNDLNIELKKESLREEINIQYNNLDLIGYLDIAVSRTNTQTSVTLDLQSYLKLTSKIFLNALEYANLTLLIENVFQFLNFRSNIKFRKILLNDSKRGIEAELVLFQSENIDYDRSCIDTITYDDLGVKSTGNLFTYIINKRCNSELHMNYIPKNMIDFLSLDIEKYLFTALTFESEFNRAYPDYRVDTNNIFKCVKQDVLNMLLTMKTEYIQNHKAGKNNKYLKYLEEFIRVCAFLDGTLEYKYNEALKIYSKSIEKVQEKFRILENVNKGKIFADLRNEIGHGVVTMDVSITGDKSKVYIWTIALIYAMVLRENELKDEQISSIVDKLFRGISVK